MFKKNRAGKWMAAAVAVLGLAVAPLSGVSAHGWHGGYGGGWHRGGPGWGGPRPGWGGGYHRGGGYWSGGRWIAGALVTGAVAGAVYSAMQPRPYYPPPPVYPAQTVVYQQPSTVVYEQPATVVYRSAPTQTVTTTTTTRYIGPGY